MSSVLSHGPELGLGSDFSVLGSRSSVPSEIAMVPKRPVLVMGRNLTVSSDLRRPELGLCSDFSGMGSRSLIPSEIAIAPVSPDVVVGCSLTVSPAFLAGPEGGLASYESELNLVGIVGGSVDDFSLGSQPSAKMFGSELVLASELSVSVVAEADALGCADLSVSNPLPKQFAVPNSSGVVALGSHNNFCMDLEVFSEDPSHLLCCLVNKTRGKAGA